MKVLCIKNDLEELPDAPKGKPIVGETYTVSDIFDYGGLEWYVLDELATDWGFNIDCFIPVSEIDEMELYGRLQNS